MSDCIDDIKIFNAETFTSAFPKARSLAVVGNGPVKEESLAHIQQADVVVRFNNFDVRKGIDQAHRTFRGDIVVTHMDCLPDRAHQPSLFLHAIPPPFQLVRNARLARNHYSSIQHAIINPFTQLELCAQLRIESNGYQHPIPTVGFTFLWHHHRLQLPHAVYVCGFTWHFDKEKQAFQRVPMIAPTLPKSMNHYYLKEARWVQQHCLRSPLYTFANDAAEALEALAAHEKLPWE